MAAAARALGLTLTKVGVDGPKEFAEAFAAMDRERTDALFVSNGFVNYTHYRLINALALKHRLPTIHELREPVELGA